jgi:hypothetical protein
MLDIKLLTGMYYVVRMFEFVKRFYKTEIGKLILSTTISSIIVLVVFVSIKEHNVFQKSRTIDQVRKAERDHSQKKDLEQVKKELCLNSGFNDLSKCPIAVKSFFYHYDTWHLKFDSGAWCMNQDDANLNDKKGAIKMTQDCKEYFINTNDELVSRDFLSGVCPFLTDTCLFKSNKPYKAMFAVIYCQTYHQYQGVSCYAVIDGDNIQRYKLTNSNMPIKQLLKERLNHFTYFYNG